MPDQHHIGLHTLSRNMPRPGSQSPPLPPPPEEHADFGRPRQQSLVAPIVPEDQNLPGWVPKNYIEKGKIAYLRELISFYDCIFQLWQFTITMLTRMTS